MDDFNMTKNAKGDTVYTYREMDFIRTSPTGVEDVTLKCTTPFGTIYVERRWKHLPEPEWVFSQPISGHDQPFSWSGPYPSGPDAIRAAATIYNQIYGTRLTAQKPVWPSHYPGKDMDEELLDDTRFSDLDYSEAEMRIIARFCDDMAEAFQGIPGVKLDSTVIRKPDGKSVTLEELKADIGYDDDDQTEQVWDQIFDDLDEVREPRDVTNLFLDDSLRDSSLDAFWDTFDDWLQKNGGQIVGIDAGFEKTEQAYQGQYVEAELGANGQEGVTFKSVRPALPPVADNISGISFADRVKAADEHRSATWEYYGVAKTRALELAIDDLVEDAHTAASKAGWWDQDRPVPEMIALMHSELSEMLEADRKDLMDDHLPHREGVEVEAADLLIRLLDFCGGRGIDLAGAYVEKRAYNARRVDHKREARAQAHGKKY